MSNRDTTSTFWERAVIYLDEDEPNKNSSQSREGVKMLPERLNMSILDKVAEGNLPNQDSKIDIFGSLAHYDSSIINNPAVADLRDRCEAEWKRLQPQRTAFSANNQIAVPEFNLQVSRLQALDDYTATAGQLLHQHQLSHPSNFKYEFDSLDDESLSNTIKDDWKRYYNAAKQKNSLYYADLKARHNTAKLSNNKEELGKLYEEQRGFRKQIFIDFQRKLEIGMCRPMMAQFKAALKELEDSYTLFQSLKLEEAKRSRTTLELIEEHDRLQNRLAENLDAQISHIDINLQAVDLLLEGSLTDIRSATTRMHRLAAVDVEDPVERLRETERRVVEAGPAYFKGYFEVADTLGFIGTANTIMDKLEGDLKALDGPVLDAYISGEMALLGLMDDLGEVDGEEDPPPGKGRRR
jgi:hypothetical protein